MLKLIEQYHKLDSIVRCNCLPRLRDNTVKAHSAGTAFAAIIIAEYEQSKIRQNIDIRSLLIRALVHDIEETITGDVPYPFKSVSGVREKLREAVKPKVKEMFFRYPHLYAHWANGKSFGIEGKILAYADMLDLTFYCIQEIELGNSHMIPVAEEALKQASKIGLNFDKSSEMLKLRERLSLLNLSTSFERGIK